MDDPPADPTSERPRPPSPAEAAARPQRAPRIVRLLFYVVWVVGIPLGLAVLAVRLITPGEPFTGGLRGFVRDQQVPAVIVFFTAFAWLLWRFRYALPFGVLGRSDLPPKLRARYEDAAQLVDEARRIVKKRGKEVERQLSRAQRDELDDALDGLEQAMVRSPVDAEVFDAAMTRAERLVSERLGRWRKGEIREYAESIGVAVGVALVLRVFVIEAFKIPSGSMIPTLMKGDHIFVAKYVYGPLMPWTDVRLYNRLPPERADVMVFKYPENKEQDFIKRTIALPGDTLEAIDGRPILNGWLTPHCYVGRIEQDADVRGELYVEFLGDESYFTMFNERTNRGCLRDMECGPGRMCLAGLCRAAAPCMSDASCGRDELCAHDASGVGDEARSQRFCRRACEGAEGCAEGESCVARAGKLCDGSGVPCKDDAQCTEGRCLPATRQACVPSGEVVEVACESDADCIAGRQCRAGVCGVHQGPYSVRPSEAWVMGDNRDNSHDSRGWNERRGGGVPFEFIKGRAMFVWLSPALERLFLSVMGDPRLPKGTPKPLEDALRKCLASRPPESATTPPPPGAGQ
ncbi:MAG: signal peptidase I [Polyangiaceae bacterium]|nr:signal peptidase I [Polyangiaceae bacterium]